LIAILRLRQNCSDWAIDLEGRYCVGYQWLWFALADGKRRKTSYGKFSQQIKIISFKKKGAAAEAAPSAD
jgi:hypothetical protein